jgi:hypothetical protein
MNATLIWLGLGMLVLAPVLTLRRFGAGWKWFGLGVLSWILGVVVKSVLTYALDTAGLVRFSIPLQATVGGVVSALTELGAAAWFLRRARLRLPAAVAFGAGVGVFEVLFVLTIGWLEGLEYPLPPEGRFAFVDGLFLLERFLALVGHTASRLMIYVGVRHRAWSPVLIALLLFSLVDGVAAYGVLAEWDWSDNALRARFLLFVAVIGTVEAILAWRFARTIKE